MRGDECGAQPRRRARRTSDSSSLLDDADQSEPLSEVALRLVERAGRQLVERRLEPTEETSGEIVEDELRTFLAELFRVPDRTCRRVAQEDDVAGVVGQARCREPERHLADDGGDLLARTGAEARELRAHARLTLEYVAGGADSVLAVRLAKEWPHDRGRRRRNVEVHDERPRRSSLLRRSRAVEELVRVRIQLEIEGIAALEKGLGLRIDVSRPSAHPDGLEAGSAPVTDAKLPQCLVQSLGDADERKGVEVLLRAVERFGRKLTERRDEPREEPGRSVVEQVGNTRGAAS